MLTSTLSLRLNFTKTFTYNYRVFMP